jgi:hypothetical protein
MIYVPNSKVKGFNNVPWAVLHPLGCPIVKEENMKKALRLSIVFAGIGLLLLGCAPTKFIYNTPGITRPSLDGTGLVLAMKTTEDQRTDRGIDESYENKKPLEDIECIIEQEIKSTGLFEKVIHVSDEQANGEAFLLESNITQLMSSQLKELRWEVPSYETKTAIAFIAGLLGGLVGGAIYGSVPTDVYGDSRIFVNLKDARSGTILIAKEYSARCTERRALFTCDTPKTKATVAGNSLKTIMEEFKADLVQAIKAKSSEQMKSGVMSKP